MSVRVIASVEAEIADLVARFKRAWKIAHLFSESYSSNQDIAMDNLLFKPPETSAGQGEP